jgi:hypothetical protein
MINEENDNDKETRRIEGSPYICFLLRRVDKSVISPSVIDLVSRFHVDLSSVCVCVSP